MLLENLLYPVKILTLFFMLNTLPCILCHRVSRVRCCCDELVCLHCCSCIWVCNIMVNVVVRKKGSKDWSVLMLIMSLCGLLFLIFLFSLRIKMIHLIERAPISNHHLYNCVWLCLFKDNKHYNNKLQREPKKGHFLICIYKESITIYLYLFKNN